MISSLKVTVLAEDSVGYESPCLGQHGISLLIETESMENGALENTRILMDVAQHPEPLLGNMQLLGIDPATIDMIVLTHCHYDHTRGLVRIIEATRREGLPVVAHPDIFRPNFETTPRLRPIGVPPADGKSRVEAAGARLILTRTPLRLAEGLTTSGEVTRETTFEGANAWLFTLNDGVLQPDRMLDDLSIYAEIEGHGIVVLSGCSHAGIVNIVRHARRICNGERPVVDETVPDGTSKIAAVVGGLHLIVADEDTINATVNGLREEHVERILAGHCTGFPAQAALHCVFGDRFSPLHTGLVVRW